MVVLKDGSHSAVGGSGQKQFHCKRRQFWKMCPAPTSRTHYSVLGFTVVSSVEPDRARSECGAGHVPGGAAHQLARGWRKIVGT